MAKFIKSIMTIETENEEELQSLLGHHIDYLIDMDANRDIINSICGVISYDIDDKNDIKKLRILSQVIFDILKTKPSNAELDYDEDAIELYSNIQKLKENLENMGID